MSSDRAAMDTAHGLAHAGATRQFERFADAIDLDLRQACPPDVYAWVERAREVDWLPAGAQVEVLQSAAIASNRHDLGVAFAMWCDMRALGPISQSWDHCTSLEEANRIARRYMHLESAAIRVSAETTGHEAALRHVLMAPARLGGSQFLQSTLTVQLRIVRMLLGEEWAPIRLELDHPAPASTRYHEAVFRCPLAFGADRCALVFRKTDLRRQSPRANPEMLHHVEMQLGQVGTQWPGDLVQQVRYVIATNLAERMANLPHVADLVGLSAQSLQRRLTERGTSFAILLEQVRKQAADEYFRTARRPNLTELSHRIGYTDASAASRFLRQHMATGARALMARGRADTRSRPAG